jgi:hypothetical protein
MRIAGSLPVRDECMTGMLPNACRSIADLQCGALRAARWLESGAIRRMAAAIPSLTKRQRRHYIFVIQRRLPAAPL